MNVQNICISIDIIVVIDAILQQLSLKDIFKTKNKIGPIKMRLTYTYAWEF